MGNCNAMAGSLQRRPHGRARHLLIRLIQRPDMPLRPDTPRRDPAHRLATAKSKATGSGAKGCGTPSGKSATGWPTPPMARSVRGCSTVSAKFTPSVSSAGAVRSPLASISFGSWDRACRRAAAGPAIRAARPAAADRQHRAGGQPTVRRPPVTETRSWRPLPRPPAS